MNSVDTKTLSQMSVLRSDGQTVRLGEFWQDQPVILAMIRHFG